MKSGNNKITQFTKTTRHVLTALLMGGLLASCGGGGGGGQATSSTPTNTIHAVISQSGGQVTLNDGTTTTFAAGIVKDGTNVTITSTAQLTSVPTQEVQALSPTVVIDIPPDSLMATAPAGSAIIFEVPLTVNATNGLAAGLSSAGALGSAINIVKVQIESTGIVGEVAIYYAPWILTQAGKFAVSIATDKLCKIPFGELACKAADKVLKGYRVTVSAYDIVQCAQQNTSLFQVDFRGGPVFNSNIQRNGKPPLILVHGWQEVGIIGLSCDKPYSSTWQTFLKEYNLDPTILDKFQVFSLAYGTSNPVQGDFGSGSEFAQAIRQQFGQEAVYVVAHSMGGLVARTALVSYGANIKGLVTLGTPHHGTPVASQEGIDLFGGTPLYPLIDYVIGGEGIMDLAWDNFDGWLQPPFHDRHGNLGNTFLNTLNTQDSYQGRYVVFAGVDNEPTIGAVIKSLGPPTLGYENDSVVPEQSALLYSSSSVPDSRIRLQKRFDGVPHFSITGHIGITDHVVVLSETRAALLGFLNDTPPTVPANLTATAFSSSQVNLSWAASSDNVGVSGYNIYRGGTLLASQPSITLSFSDNSLSPSTQYCYTISAFDAVGNESVQSNQQCVITQAIPIPTAPSGISANAGIGQATVSWNAISGVTYNIYMASVSGVTKSNFSSLADGMKYIGVTSPYTLTGLTNGTPYYFVVTAVNSYWESIESSQVSDTPQAPLYSDLNANGVADAGEIDVIVSTQLSLPTGEYHFHNLTITNNATLFLGDGNVTSTSSSFRGVKLVVDNLTVSPGASISAYRKGYSVGYGSPSTYSAGGSYGGVGYLNIGTSTYGSADHPVELGSGGGGSSTRGGGAIRLVVAATLVNDGVISADGDSSSSGGSIYVVANNMTGIGTFHANGGNLYGGGYFAGPGGGGRVALHYKTSSFAGRVEALGGCGSYDGWTRTCAGNGTAGLFDSTANDFFVGSSWRFQKNDGPFNFNRIIVSSGASAAMEDGVAITANELALSGASTLTSSKGSSLTIPKVTLDGSNITLSGEETLAIDTLILTGNTTVTVVPERVLSLSVTNLTIGAGSAISTNFKGYRQGVGPGAPLAGSQAGASYGGVGLWNTSTSIYGSMRAPVDMGSGGNGYNPRGGGALRLVVAGSLVNFGRISAVGDNTSSGGSIYVTTNSLSGTGEFRADGGTVYCPNVCFGAGGGGRIAVYYQTSSFSGLALASGPNSYYGKSGDGTVVLEQVISLP